MSKRHEGYTPGPEWVYGTATLYGPPEDRRIWNLWRTGEPEPRDVRPDEERYLVVLRPVGDKA